MIRFIIFSVLFIAVTICSHAQRRLVEISKEYTTKEIPVTDGMTYKYTIGSQNDTARYFNSNGEVLEATISFKKPGGIILPPVVVDSITIDSEQGVVYSTGWSIHGPTQAAGWHAGTISYSTAAGTTASYTFTGRQVKIYAEGLPSHGTGTVSILQGTTVIVNEEPVTFKSAVKILPYRIYDSGVLPDGTYTVRLKATGGAPTLLDFFRIFKKR